MSDPPELLTKSEAAVAVRGSERTIDRLRASGDLASVRVGGSVLIPADSVAAFLQSRRVSGDLTTKRGQAQG